MTYRDRQSAERARARVAALLAADPSGALVREVVLLWNASPHYAPPADFLDGVDAAEPAAAPAGAARARGGAARGAAFARGRGPGSGSLKGNSS